MTPIKFLVSLSASDIYDVDLIKRRISDLKEQGFDGVVLSFEDYSSEIEYLSDEFISIINEIILFSKSVEINVWVADDCHQMSGSAGGLVMNEHPSLSAWWLEFSGGMIEKKSIHEVDLLNPITAPTFIHLTHERYKNNLSKEAFSYLSGFVGMNIDFNLPNNIHNPLSMPWYEGIEEDYINEKGEDIYKKISELFIESSESSEFRCWYLQNITNRINEMFIKPISQWCSENDKQYFAFLKGKTKPYEQVIQNQLFSVLSRATGFPAIDLSGTETVNCFYPCIPSSLARQFGCGEAIASIISGCGWNLTPQKFEKMVSKLIRSGITTFIFRSDALHMDYKNLSKNIVSFPTHLTWKMALPQIFENIKVVAESEISLPHKILVLCPTRGICKSVITTNWENFGNNVVGICERLYEMGRRFDVISEFDFERMTEFGEGKMCVGDASYQTLLVTPGCSFSKKGHISIEKSKANGIRLLNDIPKSDTEIISLENIKNQIKKIVPINLHQDSWTINLPKENYFILDMNYSGNMAACEFYTENALSSDTQILITDKVETVSINNILLQLEKQDELGYYYKIKNNTVPGNNRISIKSSSPIYSYLIGDFKVVNEMGFSFLSSTHIECDYNFVLKDSGVESDIDLVRCGYPFCRQYVSAKKVIYIDENINRPLIKLDTNHMSVIEVFFDNTSLGFIYGTHDTLELPSMTAFEQHVVEIHGYPFGFNSYGQHNYINDKISLLTNKKQKLKFISWEIPKEIKLIQEF